MVDVFLIRLDPAVLVAHQGVGHGVLVDPAVGGHLPLVAGPPHQGDALPLQRSIDSSQDAGVVAAAKVDAHRIPAGPPHGPHVLLQPLYVLDRHGRGLLQHVGRSRDPVAKRDDAHAMLHDPRLVAHSNTADAGDSGVSFFQGLHMLLKLGVIR